VKTHGAGRLAATNSPAPLSPRSFLHLFTIAPSAIALLTWTLAFAALGIAPVRAANGPPIVTDIDFRPEAGGSFTASPEFLKKGLRTRIGQPLNAKIVDEDLKRLFEGGRFVATRVEQEPYEDGVRLVFYINEYPTCWRVDYKGQGAATNKMRNVTELRAGAAASEQVLRSDVRKIQEYFKGLGYAFAEIAYDVVPVQEAGEQGAYVTYVVDRGPKVVVRELRIEGNKSVKRSTLARRMKTKVDHWWSSKRYVAKKFQQDLVRIRDYYRYKGWLDVSVEADEPKWVKNRRAVELTIRITEGARYTVGDVAFKGLTLPREELAARLKLQPGSLFSEQDFDADLRRIQQHLRNKGYANVRIDRQRTFALQGNTLNLLYTVSEGEVVSIDRIDVIGNTKTKSIVVLREMRLDPGDQYDAAKVTESRQRLRETGYFSKVSIRLVDAEPPSPDRKNLLVEVEEQDTGRLTGGGGFSSINRFFLVGSFEQLNFDYRDLPPTAKDWLHAWDWFQGDGQKFRLSLSPGSLRNRYEVSFVEPWLMDRPMSLSLSLYLVDSRYFEDYSESRFGFRGGLGRRYDNGFFMEGAYKLERIEINGLPHTATLDAQAVEGTNLISGLEFTLGLRRTDSRALPSRGYNAQATFDLDGGFLGSDFDIWKARLLGQWYHTVLQRTDGGKHILGLESRLSFAGSYGSTDDVPIYERYFAGSSVVRGFAPRQLGPRGLSNVEWDGPLYTLSRQLLPFLPQRYVVEESNQPVGGDFLFAASAEYGFPLFRDEETQTDVLRGVLFFDAGTLEEDIGSDAFGQLRTAAGFGFRFVIPALGRVPVSIDFGFPISKEEQDDTQLITFSMGTSF